MSRASNERMPFRTVPAADQVELNELIDRPASAIVPRVTQWAWEHRLPAPTVAIVQGEKESGKSTWLRWLAAIVSAGGRMPGERKVCKWKGAVLWYAGEEDLETRVRPGLEAAGADLDQCHLADLQGMQEEGLLALPNDCDRLARRILYHGARLVVIDPVFSFLDGTCDIEGGSAEPRRFMRELSKVAVSTNALILLARNLTKDTSRGALSAGRGSGELANAARSVLHTQSVPSDPGVYALCNAACNDGPKTHGLTYRIVAAGKAQRIELVGKTELTADDLAAGDDGECDRNQLDQAKALIRGMLPSGKIDSKVIKGKAEGAMLSVRTVQKAARALGVVVTRKGSRESTITYWGVPKSGWGT